VVSWFGSRDATFARRLRALDPNAVIAGTAANGTRCVWEHLLETVGASIEAARGPVTVSSALGAEGRHALREAGWDGRRRLLMVHPGAGGLGKRRPIERFPRRGPQLPPPPDPARVLPEGPVHNHAGPAGAGTR